MRAPTLLFYAIATFALTVMAVFSGAARAINLVSGVEVSERAILAIGFTLALAFLALSLYYGLPWRRIEDEPEDEDWDREP